MKKVTVTLGYAIAPNLTKMVGKLQQTNMAQGARVAQSGSGDTVYWIRSSKTNFTLEYCVKDSVNGTFVNWARVSGAQEDVTRFLIGCEHFDYVEIPEEEKANVVIPKLYV